MEQVPDGCRVENLAGPSRVVSQSWLPTHIDNNETALEERGYSPSHNCRVSYFSFLKKKRSRHLVTRRCRSVILRGNSEDADPCTFLRRQENATLQLCKMEVPDFLTFDYLREGNPGQRLAFQELEALRVQQILARFTPVLAGTVPIGIYVETSDLDIICYVTDSELEAFEKIVKDYYGSYKAFTVHRRSVRNQPYVIANFQGDHFDIEIFGQPIPVVEQNAYRHMIIEHKLLERRGEPFCKEVLDLKRSGMKTEPAFAKVLKLEGDPYDALLKLEATGATSCIDHTWSSTRLMTERSCKI